MDAAGPKKRTFERSSQLLERALKRIPLGSQTFSKSHVQFPRGAAPLYLSRGKGGRVWDVDGNEYVDLVCGLLPVLLGYCDPDVDDAIRAQLDKGISFSLATELEIELAEALAEIVPCADMSRFGKNGSDATSAAVRIARAATGRDHIAVCGYHGWHDWYVGATARFKGVPDAVRALTHVLPFGDIDAFRDLLKAHQGDVAGIIMEPMNVSEPAEGYLAEMGELAHQHGALFMFDEVISGFRFAMGGAQELFGVTPDIAAYGKGMGNGMPISAVCGRADLMAQMDEVFISGTFGGETLSLAAALAVIKKLKEQPVIAHLKEFGARLSEALENAIQAHGLSEVIQVSGHPTWRLLSFADHKSADRHEIKTFLITRLLQKGVLSNGSHNICFAHDEYDFETCQAAYDFALGELAAALSAGALRERLGCEPVYPVFMVR